MTQPARPRLATFLSGVKVLDLSRHLPGPLASLILADLGAEVLKIEPPQGDEMRTIGGESDELSPYYRTVNAGKRVCRIDLKSAAGRDRLIALVRDADVLIESFRPGTLARLGLGAETLCAVNPRLVYCALNGFGETSPLRDRAGHDLNYLALTGMLAAVTGPGRDPQVPYPPPADCSAAFMGAIAILGALHGRGRDGKGATIDLALADAPLLQLIFSFADLGREDRTSSARAMLGGDAAFYNVYRVRDGHVTLGAVEPKFWGRFCAAAGRPDWIARQQEPMPQTALRRELEDFFLRLTLAEAQAVLEPADCCFAPVVPLQTAVGSPWMTARGLLGRGTDGLIQPLFPAVIDGEHPMVRPPLDDSP